MDNQVPNAVEILPKISTAWVRCTKLPTTDRQTTDGRATAYSERRSLKSECTVLMGYLTISTNVRRYQTHHRWQFFSFRKTAHWCTRIVHATQSNCCGTVDLLSPETCPPTAPSWTHCLLAYKISGVIQLREYQSWVKKILKIKQQLVDLWQCTDTAFELTKCDFRISRFAR